MSPAETKGGIGVFPTERSDLESTRCTGKKGEIAGKSGNDVDEWLTVAQFGVRAERSAAWIQNMRRRNSALPMRSSLFKVDRARRAPRMKVKY